MNRSELQSLASLRRKEAKSLLDAGHFAGAYYLMGYAIECALKSCIAKATKRHEFPDKHLATKVFTHNLEDLMRLSGVSPIFDKELKSNAALALNWTIVKDWNERARYRASISEQEARDLYSACTRHKNGILTWVRKVW